MPQQVKDIKVFIQYSRRKDASAVRIKASVIKPTAASKKILRTKFKLRCKRNLYTLVLDDEEKANKLKSSLPPGLKVEEVDAKRKK